MGTTLLISVVFLAIRLVGAEAVYQRARTAAGLLYFPAGRGLRLLLRVGAPLLVFTAYKMTQVAISSFDLVMAALVALMGIGCVVFEPREIIATPQGLVQKSLFGLRKRSLSWEKATASYNPREVLVVGRNGVSITHTPYHVGRDQLLTELKSHNVFTQGYRQA